MNTFEKLTNDNRSGDKTKGCVKIQGIRVFKRVFNNKRLGSLNAGITYIMTVW